MRPRETGSLVAAGVGALVALTLSGCGGGSGQETGRSDAAGSPTTSAGTAAPDACRLITTDEVAQVFVFHLDWISGREAAKAGCRGSRNMAGRCDRRIVDFTCVGWRTQASTMQTSWKPAWRMI